MAHIFIFRSQFVFESNPEYDRMVDEVYAIAGTRKRGDMIHHSEIGEIFGIKPNQGYWQHLMDRVRARLEREDHISMLAVPGKGYKLCTVSEQLSLGPTRLQRAARQVQRGERSVRALSFAEGLSPQQRNRQALILMSLSKQKRAIRFESRAAFAACKPSSVHPKRLPLASQ